VPYRALMFFRPPHANDPDPSRPRGWALGTHFDPVTDTDPEQLASSPAGTAARDIYQHVLAWQGPDGQLATRQLQRHVRRGSDRGWGQLLVAYWSPDGQFGHAR
jgi:hypothetical protein